MTIRVNEPDSDTTHSVTCGSFIGFCTVDTFADVTERVVERAGGGVPKVALWTPPPPLVETTGETVATGEVDETAKARIDEQQAALVATGLVGARDVGTAGNQLYKNGTRMMDLGYAKQGARKAEHEAMPLVRDAVAAFVDEINAEHRRDIRIKARDIANTIDVNGVASFEAGGERFKLSETAIRGMLARLGSPMLGGVLGVRDRMVGCHDANDRRADKEFLARILSHELARYGDIALQMRVRHSTQDCFAVVSPGYVPADANTVFDAEAIAGFPADARGRVVYDPKSTNWEVRAEVFTPTPVQEQAVGEPFRAYASISSRDNGTRTFRGGGGMQLIACLNAMVYCAKTKGSRRRHSAGIILDVPTILGRSAEALTTLVEVWGKQRQSVVEEPEGVIMTDVIPDLWTSLLKDRTCELAGVLPGSTKQHAEGLTAAYHDQRRDQHRLVTSDLAQAWTRYIQDQRPDVRADAEAAVGSWLVSGPRVIVPNGSRPAVS